MSVAGIPAHPLIVHLTVVAVPVAALLLLVWAVAPRLRGRLATLTVVVAAVGAAATLGAKFTGEALLEAQGFSEHNPGPVADHAGWADFLTVAVFVMLAVAAGYWFFSRRPATGSVIMVAIRVLAAAVAVAALVTVIGTGHEGAALVWANNGS
ncbi:hypothetical protein CATRI_09010 [Corynebacterium atrinae]|nr:hypothetical protein CATRI_09010 [Corynebacterium atrinae]